MDIARTEDELCAILSPESAANLAAARERWMATDDAPEFLALATDPDYPEIARTLVDLAADRARSVASGDLPFTADRTFTPAESTAVGRAATIGLLLDTDWAPTIFELLHNAGTNPGDGRSVPSQSMVHALARAILAAPTPEGVLALDSIRSATGHAGIKKKFAKYLPVARRALAARPQVALRLPHTAGLTAAAIRTWTVTLESSWLATAHWPREQWINIVGSHPEITDICQRVLWCDERGRGFRIDGAHFRNADGALLTLDPDTDIALWHPVARTDAELRKWHTWLIEHAVSQPFAQVLREHFGQADALAIGRDHPMVELRTLTGVARSQGWQLGATVCRRVGSTMAELTVDGVESLYPGCAGQAHVAALRVGSVVRAPSSWGSHDNFEFTSAPANPIVVSELVRSAQLLLSAAAVTHQS